MEIRQEAISCFPWPIGLSYLFVMLYLTICCCLFTLSGSYLYLKRNNVLHDLLRNNSNTPLGKSPTDTTQHRANQYSQTPLDHRVASLDDARSKKLDLS
ncbi:MAG: hypothetical protein Ct9H90mP30_1010 [Actinomycetota bacterium]|nr:MAG: hypothetical protein Ct9H90mP30_1010 [Actinomycetota bacterium]